MSILDVGCGPGTITVDLARLVPRGKVVGLECESAGEILQQAVDSSKENDIHNAEFIIGDVCNIVLFHSTLCLSVKE